MQSIYNYYSAYVAQDLGDGTSVLGRGVVMKMRNIVPRERFEPIPLAFCANVITITHT